MSASAVGIIFKVGGRAVADIADVVIVGADWGAASRTISPRPVRQTSGSEREPHLGRGSTGKSMGGVRAQFSTEINIRLSVYALDFFARFEEGTGYPGGYRPQGYLFVATNEKHRIICAPITNCKSRVG